MIQVHPSQLTVHERAVGLRAWPSGSWGTEAAVELLVRHGYWLDRDDFLHAAVWCPQVDDAEADLVRVDPFVGIDWALATAFAAGPPPASGTDLGVLRVAISVASHRQLLALTDELAGLDEATMRLILTAIGHAAGWHEQGVAALVDGRF